VAFILALSFSVLAATASAMPETAAVEEAITRNAAEQAADSAEQAADSAEYAEVLAEAAVSPRTAERFPAYASKIERIKFLIAKYLEKKRELRKLPASSKRRQRDLSAKAEKLKAERVHLREVRAALTAKKEAVH
jgi:hypothetical protein